MDLVIDIGNTNISFGVFDRDDTELKKSFRLMTPKLTTTDELAFNLGNMLRQNGITNQEIKRSIFSSVVPSLNHNITKMMKLYYGQDIYMVGIQCFDEFVIHYREKEDLGIDRLVNLKAVQSLVGLPAIVVDFGTATTIDVMNEEKKYLGGMIIPGIAISLNALVENTSKLPKIELENPKEFLGFSTKENMQNGLFYLNSIGINGILEKAIKMEQLMNPSIVITGGLANFISQPWSISSILIENLTLKGLKTILDEI